MRVPGSTTATNVAVVLTVNLLTQLQLPVMTFSIHHVIFSLRLCYWTIRSVVLNLFGPWTPAEPLALQWPPALR